MNEELKDEVVIAKFATTTKHGAKEGKTQTHLVDYYNLDMIKGANFLYLIVKNHVFVDGNKRIASTLFIYFLNYYDILYKNGVQTIDNNTLADLTLLVAESNPKEKEVIVDLIMNFLNNE